MGPVISTTYGIAMTKQLPERMVRLSGSPTIAATTRIAQPNLGGDRA
jgi:hypothetical protein